ncbi:UNKNOWN [Stylonychia lemnae]|uniref:START domain-containing protein n=1 Tax=Stylonychia lemnae TaxID=5949 RepID=A0A078ACU8_STYLE|nr:UNKNOWN [Stylonychia lemnae]|eukprot:CDW80080.1 UNKNOWN [Stylonychia lemnae]
MKQRKDLNRILRLQLAIINDESSAPILHFPERVGKNRKNKRQRQTVSYKINEMADCFDTSVELKNMLNQGQIEYQGYQKPKNNLYDSFESYKQNQNDQHNQSGMNSRKSSNSKLSFCNQSFSLMILHDIGTANDLKSQNSDPEGQCGLQDLLDVPKNIINEHETDYVFTKQFLIDFINDLEKDQAGLQQKLDANNTRVWTKTGSKYDKSNPFIKCEWTFNETNDPRDYMDFNKRLKWDDGLAEYSELLKANKNVQVVYVVSKAPLNFKNRDFLDKRIFFKHEGAYYIYITSAPDSVKPPTNQNQRAKSVVGCFKIMQTPDKKGVKMMGALQTDLKIGFGLNMVAALLPKAMNEWGDKIRKFLLTNDSKHHHQ